MLASIPYAIYAPNDIEGTIQGKVNLTNVLLIFKNYARAASILSVSANVILESENAEATQKISYEH